MKRIWLCVVFAGWCVMQTGAVQGETAQSGIGPAVETYFAELFEKLGDVAAKKPTVKTFRDAMKPLVTETPGFFGGTLIDTNFVIRQVYYSRNFLARGYDLKKVRQLDVFWDLMRKAPTPQLSEPARGSILQPRLIAMRYPVMTNGKLEAVVSIMVRTETFLAQTGLDQCKGMRITCRDVVAEETGDLTGTLESVRLDLPATDWLIEYKR